MSTCPPLLLDSPPPTERYVGGLFAAATMPPPPPGGKWECGVQYESETCANPIGWHADCNVPRVDKQASLQFPLVEAKPFQVILGVECPLVGYTLEEFERRVRQAFVLCEQRAVERIFMTGSEGNNGLASLDPLNPSTCTVPDGLSVTNPLTITGAVAAIEDYMGDNYCGTPVIHSPRAVASYAAAHNLVVRDGRLHVTPLGTRWAFGGGYSANVGPDGTPAPAGVAWLYATGAVTIWRSEVWTNPDDLEQAFNRKTNDVLLFAERTYAIGWECACIAIPVAVSCNC